MNYLGDGMLKKQSLAL